MRALLELFRARRREFALSHGLRALLRGSCGNRSRRGMSLLASRLRYLWITLAVVVLDRATKAWFESQTPLGWRHEVISNFVYLVYSRNPGIAFGVLSDSASVWTRVVLIGGSVAVIVVLAWLLVSLRGGALTLAGIAFLIGGAAGNLADRIAHGAVTDFFDVAHSSIPLVAILIILDLIFSPHKDRAPASRREH